MKFRTVAELVELAETEQRTIAEVMLKAEMSISQKSADEIYDEMYRSLDIMEKALERSEKEEIRSTSGLTGGDARKLSRYMEGGQYLSGDILMDAVRKAIGTNEVNAAMGTIVATPTAGSCGIVPGTLFAVKERFHPSRKEMADYLLTAGAFGYVIANNAFIAGATGGCQAETGSAAAMAAGAIVEMAGGTPFQASHAMAIALKNVLGLVCDPVAGLVEVPCVKRNAIGAANAIVSADMALAGITSVIPPDEVILAMYRIGLQMPHALKETALGGLAATPTGIKLQRQIFGQKSE
ncbi:L-serine ammonia-lyase, iron-sulfur-dependent, subunit alpha [Rubeoparvulum massiliense]|uniref:L-serine ammonia-lyase, iron-sulfur-dependent, subunit alpha n=1 Tax=Rubeoparvulum massiliense TaxID=1631346 RepID=UPI00065E1E09|nr:L-serine ammonia-lyase, iron-sulfur-dependent, subunit alpha [Rubeoparvulum massiliense]